MADTHVFIGSREVGKTKLRTTASGASNSSTTSSMWGIGGGGGGGGGGPRKSPQQRISDILRMRRLRLNRAKTTTASSLSDSLSESANNVMRGSARGSASRANSNSLMSNSSSDGFCRNNSGVSYQSARSTRSNMTAVSTLSSTGSSTSYSKNRKDKRRRLSKYDEEPSDGQLGINEKELNSMNKHIPALRIHGKSATFRQHYYPEGGWGWVITFCCFLVNIFTTGLQLSFSVLSLEIIRLCGTVCREDKISVVWIGSTNLAVSHLSAPFLVALCRRKSVRLTAVVGGLVMTLSLLFASFAKHFDQIFLSYGLLCGIGCAMVRETSSLMLGQYFKRKRELVEALSTMGIGFGLAIFSNVYHVGLGTLGWRLGLQAVTGSAISLFFLGLFYRSASLYHPQRRAILHLKDMSKRKGKDKNKIESKPPYFDCATIKIRSFQVILAAVFVASLGIYAPVFFLVPLAIDEGLGDDAILLQTFMGVSTSIGAFLFGIVILSKSQQCMISRQYLLQTSIFGIGISMLALASVEGYHGYLMFVWMYGLFVGGMEVALKVYCYERLRIKQNARGWGFIQGARALPTLIGLPITAHIAEATGDPKAGFYFSFSCCILSGTILFLMECFKGGQAASFYGGSRMDLCKTDTNMSLEMNGTGLGPSVSQQGDPLGVAPLSRVPSSGLAQGEVVMPPASVMTASNGHLKCTCLPSIGAADSEIDENEKMKDGGMAIDAEPAGGMDLAEVSMAMAEVSTASCNNSKVHFNDEIEVVLEEEQEGRDQGRDQEEDEMIDLAEALYAAGVSPELLAAISEEDSDEDRSDLHDVDEEEVLGLMWSEYEPQMEVMLIDDRLPASPGSPAGPRLLTHSLSEPDLLSIKLPHFSSRPVAGGIDPIRQLPVRRQKTWHQFNKPIIKNSLKKPASPPVAVAVPVLPPGASFAEEPEVTSNEEATSFV